MFDSQNGDFDIQKSHINGIGEYVITSGVTNNGILGKTNISAKVIDAGTITIDMFGNSFYRYFKYKMVTHARVFSLIPKFDMNKEQGLYIVNSFKYLIFEFGFGNMCSWAKIQNKKIQLPTKDGKIDFEFMEYFIAELEAQHIAELEAQHIAELEAYLKVAGLHNYELTSDEKKSIDNFNNIKWGEYRIGDLFEKKTIKGIPKSQENLVENPNGYHVFGQNIYYQYPQRVLNDDKYLTKIEVGKPIIAYTSSTAQIGIINESFYRTGDNGAFQGLFPNFKEYNYNQILFILVAMKRNFIGLGYNTSMAHVKDLYIKLPTKNNKIDFEFMELLISAVQKLIIKDVVLWKDKTIETTKQVVGRK